MGAGHNINEKVFSYYFFQKKIECLLNLKKNPFFKSNGEDLKSGKFYVINKEKVQEWKYNIGYVAAKYYLDKIRIKDTEKYINQLKNWCIHLEENKVIEDYNFQMNDNDNLYSYLRFISKIKLGAENFENLIDEKTFDLFNNNKLNKTKSYLIKGIITDKMIILFIKEHFLCKILFNKEFNGNSDLIQLSVDCTIIENDNKVNKGKSEKNFEEFKKYIKSQGNKIIEELESKNINFLNEINFTYKNGYSVLIKNENLNFNQLSKEYQIKNNDFNNVNTFRKIGLTNVGATCYMNATLQCLINVNSLTTYLMTPTVYNNIIKNISSCELISAYCEVVYHVCCNSKVTNYYEPQNFKKIISSKNPLFKGISANDSKDLINFLLEEMNHELSILSSSKHNNSHKKNKIVDQTNKMLTYNNFKNDIIENNDSKIARIFFFTIETQTSCQNCGILKYNYQVLYLIEFQLETVFNFCISNNMNQIKNNGQKFVNLLQCFEQYRSPTYFTGENSLYCNICKSQQNATYINNIYSLPPTLIIVLNRGKGNSFDCEVDFPINIDLQQYVTCPQSITSYQLRGVITHLGESGMSGHFMAYCKNRIDNNWYCYNDSIVSFCDDQRNGFRKGTPYILFYESLNGNNNILYDKNNLQGNDNLNYNNNIVINESFINKNISNISNINNNMRMNIDNKINNENNILIYNMFKMNSMNSMDNMSNNMNYMNNLNNINNKNSMNNMNFMNNLNNNNIYNINKMNINNINNMNNMNSMNNSNMNNLDNSNGNYMNKMNNNNFNSINNNINNFNNINMNNMNNCNMNNSNINNMNNLNNCKKNNMNNININNMNNCNINNMNNINNNNKENNMNKMNNNIMNSINNNIMNNIKMNFMNNSKINNKNLTNINNNNKNKMNNSNINFSNNKNMNNYNIISINTNNKNNMNILNNSNMNNNIMNNINNNNINSMNNKTINNMNNNNMNNKNMNNMNNNIMNNKNINSMNNSIMNNKNTNSMNNNIMNNNNMNNMHNMNSLNNNNMNSKNNSNMNSLNNNYMNNNNMNNSNMNNKNMNYNNNNIINSNMNNINNLNNNNMNRMNNINMINSKNSNNMNNNMNNNNINNINNKNMNNNNTNTNNINDINNNNMNNINSINNNILNEINNSTMHIINNNKMKIMNNIKNSINKSNK